MISFGGRLLNCLNTNVVGGIDRSWGWWGVRGQDGGITLVVVGPVQGEGGDAAVAATICRRPGTKIVKRQSRALR